MIMLCHGYDLRGQEKHFAGELQPPVDKADNEAHPELKQQSAIKSKLKSIGSKMSGGKEVRTLLWARSLLGVSEELRCCSGSA